MGAWLSAPKPHRLSYICFGTELEELRHAYAKRAKVIHMNAYFEQQLSSDGGGGRAGKERE